MSNIKVLDLTVLPCSGFYTPDLIQCVFLCVEAFQNTTPVNYL